MKESWILLCLLCCILMFLDRTRFVLPACTDQSSVTQTEWTKYDFPNPQVDIRKCGRCKSSWICDPNLILKEFRADTLDRKIEEFRTTGKCVCSSCAHDQKGYSIAIGIVERMNNPGTSDDQIEASAKSFASFLREKWDFEACENDIVIFLSNSDKKIFTSVGKKTEEIIGYKCIGRIYEEVKPQLSAGNYANALDYMVEHYRETLNTGVCSISDFSMGAVAGIVVGVIAFCILIIVIVVCCIYRRRVSGSSGSKEWRGGGGVDGPGGEGGGVGEVSDGGSGGQRF